MLVTGGIGLRISGEIFDPDSGGINTAVDLKVFGIIRDNIMENNVTIVILIKILFFHLNDNLR